MAETRDPLVLVPARGDGSQPADQHEEDRTIMDPGKVVRLAAMAQVLLGEANSVELDEAARGRIAEIYERSVDLLSELLSEDLQDELLDLGVGELSRSEGPPSSSELRIAQAQLVGWLEGLFRGIRATLTTQHLAQQEQLAELYADAVRSAREQEERRVPGAYL